MARRYEQTEWLGLVDISGPFLAGVVLDETFPQGLEKIETPRKQHLRSAYEEWDDARDQDDPELEALHDAWVRLVLQHGLEFEEEVLADAAAGDEVPVYEASSQGEAFRPDFVLESLEGDPLLFVAVYPPGTDLDQPQSRGWVASPIERMKLLCRSQQVRVGLLTNGEEWTLVNAPEDDTSGHTTWFARNWWLEPVTFKAFVSLLGVRRFFGPDEERLDQLLHRSLKEHHEVTDTLGEQVRRAVEVLVQALGRADEDRNGELLKGVAPAELYNAGLTTMMRLVFLLCAEERGLLLLGDPVYDQHYAVSTLRGKLEDDKAHHGVEVLERRYDAWSRLLSLFRAVYGGIEHESLRMPAMGGSLFDPDRFPFLEGRSKGSSWREVPASPLPIDNRTVMLLLRALLVLEHRGGARQLSYRGLDVEQVGHVYEGLLEYKVERVPVLTVGLGGSASIQRPTMSLKELESLLAAGVPKAASVIAKATGRSKSAITKALQKEPENDSLPPLVHACGGDEGVARRLLPFSDLMRSDSWGVPLVYGAGSFAITLGGGRRESGSHYTPRALTEPIVAITLRPLLDEMGDLPTADQILGLKICDPAMGSGAFLVEACRQLGAQVVEAWSRAEAQGKSVTVNGAVVEPSSDVELLSRELADRLVTARRLVTERCLYGVDKNPMAVDLAKLSLWLVTMAKGRPFGFLDHKFKHGDSLVGLTKAQIRSFHWQHERRGAAASSGNVQLTLDEAIEWRRAIGEFGEFDYAEKQQVYDQSERELRTARLIGDLAVAAFFGAEKPNAKEQLRRQYLRNVGDWRTGAATLADLDDIVRDLRTGEKAVPPLHWEIEFPEVFDVANPGFDAVVGNPPFAGSVSLAGSARAQYTSWLRTIHTGTGGKCDLVAFFFRAAFELLRSGGAFGLVATNTIAQGDTRVSGLQAILQRGGLIYNAQRRLVWPGKAAVVVSVVHVAKQLGNALTPTLDGKCVERITAYLLTLGPDLPPKKLVSNANMAFLGTKPGSKGFVVGSRSGNIPHDRTVDLLVDERLREVIQPYIGGSEFNSDPGFSPNRWIVNFGTMSREEAKSYSEAFELLKEYIAPKREDSSWWVFARRAVGLYEAIRGQHRTLAISETCNSFGFGFLPTHLVYSNSLYVIATDQWSAFAVCQSRVHEIWVRTFASTFKDDQRYVGADCFDPFPLPEDWLAATALLNAGRSYYEFRSEVMIRNGEGLTKTYNRFHDPSNREPDIVRLRELHDAMDRAVLDAYGWPNVPMDCEFLLDYEIDEETWGNKKKPYRYRWPDDVQDEVLARLLELNQQRYEIEAAEGLHGKKAQNETRSRKQAPVKKPDAVRQASSRVKTQDPDPELLRMKTSELVALGTSAAKHELRRRGRDPITGKKGPQRDLFS